MFQVIMATNSQNSTACSFDSTQYKRTKNVMYLRASAALSEVARPTRVSVLYITCSYISLFLAKCPDDKFGDIFTYEYNSSVQ